jgi:hypothetical protein
MLPPDLPTPADTSFTIQTSLSGDIITPISPQFAAIVVIRRQQFNAIPSVCADRLVFMLVAC